MLIIGCGNPDRGDDGAGVMVGERLRELGLNTKICTGESLALIEAWSRAEDVVVVDTVVTGAPVGTVWEWNARSVEIQRNVSTSSHGFGVGEAIELGRILDRLPKRLRVVGIEGRKFDIGTAVSPEVMCAVEQAVQRIVAEMLRHAGAS